MKVFQKIKARQAYLAVVGLGYVGLPLAVAFAEKIKTVGFDINEDKITIYQKGQDPTQEVGNERLMKSLLEFTSDASKLQEARFIIVAVPTPINGDKTPDLLPLKNACSVIGKQLVQDTIVVFESTVYPGVTEDICVPILEAESGLVCGVDFKVGYSPERINPGDKLHRVEGIVKIVSGMDEESLEDISAVYELIIEAGVYRAPNIKVAEAAKLVENAQRDINIAFMNELAMVFDRMGIETNEVIQAMNTKWNALGFYPGLVGGHCIGVDPYYFIYQAEMLGYHSQIIAAGRKINDGMGSFIAQVIIKKLIQANKNVSKAKIYIMGITFKEDCPDVRNSKAVEVCTQLSEYGIQVNVVDPVVDQKELKRKLGISIVDMKEIADADCLVFLVGHKAFQELHADTLESWFGSDDSEENSKILIDVKSIFPSNIWREKGYVYWSL
ncbi:nucleotide sugar dehydrogenase [Anaerosinus massiliensis]|uniref:nucleotide sugar dehydrogenase n=1 Tax=Massilibacillus massiliensis TaxID=1806837 RepID=UPI000AC62DFA|nr:nucleotide sugar dehydrogenase [Massilibacillus massiliensis]